MLSNRSNLVSGGNNTQFHAKARSHQKYIYIYIYIYIYKSFYKNADDSRDLEIRHNIS